MIKVFDNFVEEHVAQLIDMQMREVSWKYDYDSVPNGTQKHWHVFCGHKIDECKLNGFDFNGSRIPYLFTFKTSFFFHS